MIVLEEKVIDKEVHLEMKKRILAMILAAAMVFTSFTPAGGNVYGAEVNDAVEGQQEIPAEAESEIVSSREETFLYDETNLPTGLEEMEVFDVTFIPQWQICNPAELSMMKKEENGTYSAIYENEWDKYSSNYYLNQMTDSKRRTFENLYALCMEYLTTEKDAVEVQSNGKTSYMTGYVDCGSLTKEEVFDVIGLIRAMYPQFYFLTTTCWRGESGGKYYAALGIYEAFIDGEVRAGETAKVKNVADSMIAGANGYGTDEEKLKYLHDTIVKKVEYNHEEYVEQEAFTQSAYSVFCKDLTVCAGYAQALSMVCNGAGIDAIAVSGTGHRWNMVKINDSWYNVDATWADKGGDNVSYKYYGRSSAVYADDYSSNVTSHTVIARDAKYVPPCTLDTGNTISECKPFPTITESVIAPEISIQPNGENYLVTLSCQTEGASIYYTQNGEEPSSAATRCFKYTAPFETTSLDDVKAMAVCDAYLDSDVTTDSVEPLVLSYDGNGTAVGTMPEKAFLSGLRISLKENAYIREGYTFTGWNTKADGTGLSYSNMAEVDTSAWTENVTLYAQWSPDTYSITYYLDSGINHDSNPANYNSETSVVLNTPVKNGYQFEGWYLDAGYQNKIAEIKKGTRGNLTLYAKWSIVDYSITYQLKGGTNGSNPVSYDVTEEVSFKNPTRKGYTFAGWYTDAAYKNKIIQIKKGTTGNLTLYAKWKAKSYSIVYKGNGSTSGKMSKTSCKYGTAYKLRTNKFKKKGYTFVGWNTKADGSGKSYKNKASIKNLTSTSNKKITLYAQWKKTKYKVTYKLNGGKNHKKNPTSYYITTSTKKLKNPTRKGYVFKGWYTDKKYKNKITQIKKGSTGNITLYAKWKKK